MLTEFGLGTNVGGQLSRTCATSSVASGGAAPPLTSRMGTLPACSWNAMFVVVGAAVCAAVTMLW